MESIPLIAQIYILSFFVGFLFVMVTAAMTGMSSHSQMGHGQGGHGLPHGGADGHGLLGHGHGHSHSHTDTGPSHSHGHSHGGSHGAGHDQDTSSHSHKQMAAQHSDTKSGSLSGQTLQTTIEKQRQDSSALLFLRILNPTSIAVFLTFFGATGFFIWKLVPMPIVLTTIPAFVCALLAARTVLSLLSLFASKLSANTRNFKMQDLLGYEAETTCAINPGGIGEITYAFGSKRYTNPAKGKDRSLPFKRSAKVIIVDILEDGLLLIEPWISEEDEFLKLEQKQKEVSVEQEEV